MAKTMKLLPIIALLAASAASASPLTQEQAQAITEALQGTDPPADICTGPYFYQRACDTTWFAAWPGSGQSPGHHYQGCSAHTWIVHGEDGKDYPIINQHPAVGGFRRAPDAAPSSQAAWDRCFLPPHQFEGGPTYRCSTTPPVAGVLIYTMKTLAQVPDPPRSSFAGLFGCSGPPQTPVPTLTPSKTRTPGGPTATRTKTPTLGPVPCDTFPGGPICTPTRTPTTIQATATPIRTATSLPTSTPAPTQPPPPCPTTTCPPPAITIAPRPTSTPGSGGGGCGNRGASLAATLLVMGAVLVERRRRR